MTTQAGTHKTYFLDGTLLEACSYTWLCVLTTWNIRSKTSTFLIAQVLKVLGEFFLRDRKRINIRGSKVRFARWQNR